MRNDILKVIKEQNWGALENFEFEKKNGDRKIYNFLENFFFFFSSPQFSNAPQFCFLNTFNISLRILCSIFFTIKMGILIY